MTCLLMFVAVAGITFAQTPPSTESLDQIMNLFLNQTLEKFDVVFFQNKIVSGMIRNSELSFRLENDQQATYQISEIAVVILDLGKGEFILRSSKRFRGQLLTPLEINLAGFENQRITLRPEIVGTAIFKGQHKYLVNNVEFGAKFQELLIDHLRHSITRRDILVFRNDSVLAGTVTNPIFQIDNLYFNKETIAEIVFGPPDKLRTKSGQIVNGVIRNPAVILQLISGELRFSFPTQVLTRILFEDLDIKLAPEEARGIVVQISED